MSAAGLDRGDYHAIVTVSSPRARPRDRSVSARTGSLAPGRYNATVQIVSGVANNNPQEVAVSFDVEAAPPAIGLSSTAVTVSTSAGGPNPGVFDVRIINSGSGPLSGLTSSVNYGPGQPTGWLAAPLSSTSAPSTLSIQATRGALAPGVYNATIVIAAVATNSPQAIGVTFIVTPAILAPAIALSPAGLTFNAAEAGADPAASSIAVANSGGGPLGGLTVGVAYAAGQPAGWLSAQLNANAAPTSISVQAATGALLAGAYSATISVSSPDAPNSPQVATVTFVVDPPAAPPAG